MRFKGTDSDVDIATEHQEFSNWQWLAVDQLAENIVPFKRPVYEKVLAAFAVHL
jgi:putative (di)nucleoside polyphosphate hydrolase